ncbi:MAG: hypothetical protein U5L72_07500 [Bacteroidales bacterium]|nr:hypothetical protein [Bacteroidales bacterium]
MEEIMSAMKIKKVQLSEKDKRKAYKTAVRKAIKESGSDRLTRSVAYRKPEEIFQKGPCKDHR